MRQELELAAAPHLKIKKEELSFKVKKYKEPYIRVNICWQVGDEKKCATLSKEQAYATRDWVEKQDGVCFWFQALPD